MKYVLITLISFVTFSSLLGGFILMSVPDGSLFNLSVSSLKETIFKDYQILGLLLFVFIGLTNLFALYYTLQHRFKKFTYVILASILLCIWAILQLIYFNHLLWLSTFYFTISIITILISNQLKGRLLI